MQRTAKQIASHVQPGGWFEGGLDRWIKVDDLSTQEQIPEELCRGFQVVGDITKVDLEEMEPYSHDEVVGLQAYPEVVVRATTAQQVSEVLRLAQRECVPVTPRGAGQGLSGGAVP